MSAPMFKPDLKSPPWLAVAREVRSRGQRVTPYRLGLIVGRENLGLPCPYTLQRSVDLFREGVKWGRRDGAKATKS